MINQSIAIHGSKVVIIQLGPVQWIISETKFKSVGNPRIEWDRPTPASRIAAPGFERIEPTEAGSNEIRVRESTMDEQ